jgi:hypothetical protein
MKRIVLACFLLTAAVGIATVQPVSAYAAPTAPVTQASFMVKINLMDSQIGAGNIAAANATWDEINIMMMDVLGVTKHSIATAATPAAAASFETIHSNQAMIYQIAWNLKGDLATNRVAIKAKLVEFKLTIY